MLSSGFPLLHIVSLAEWLKEIGRDNYITVGWIVSIQARMTQQCSLEFFNVTHYILVCRLTVIQIASHCVSVCVCVHASKCLEICGLDLVGVACKWVGESSFSVLKDKF